MAATIHKFPTPKRAPKKAPAKAARSEADNAVNFTDGQVKAWLRNPPEGRPEFQDATDPKLRVRVSPGLVSFSLYQWNPHTKKPQRWQLGRVTSVTAPEMSVAQVRSAAKVLKGDIEKGSETVTRKMEGVTAAQAATVAAQMSVAALVTEYNAEKRRGGRPLAPESRAIYEESARTFFGKHYTRPISDLSPETVLKLYRARCERREVIAANGRKYLGGNPVQALSALDLLKAICRRHNLPDVTELTRKRDEVIRKPARPARMGSDDAQKLMAWAWAETEADPHSFVGTGAAMMILATVLGWRVFTLRALRWEWFDWKASLVRLPAWAVKGKRDVTYPLPPRVAALLKARQEGSATDLVFPQQGDGDKAQDIGTTFLSYVPAKCSAHDGKKAFVLALYATGASEAATKLLAMHSVKGNTTLESYFTTNPEKEVMAAVRPAIVAVENHFLKLVGNRKAVKEMRDASIERHHEYKKTKNRLHAAKRASKRTAK